MVLPETPDRLASNAFGGADWLKVQSQHERFLREIKHLPEEEKAKEMINAIKYLIENKSDYWLETAHLLHVLMGDSENEGLYKKIAPGMTKKDFCKVFLKMSHKTILGYIEVIRDYGKYGFTEEQIRVLGFSKTRDVMRSSPHGEVNPYSKQTIEQLKKLTYADIRPKKQKSAVDLLSYYWKKATAKEKEEFLGTINGERKNSDMGKNHSRT